MTRLLPRFFQGSRSLVFPLFQLVTCLLMLALSAPAQTSLEQISTPAQKGFTGIFGGGPFYKTANFNVPKNIAEIEHSGFSEAIVWSVEVNSQGDLNFNGEFPLTSNGVYVGGKTYPKFAADMATLKQAGIVKRVTFSIGSSNYGDWENITALVKAQGVGPKSILYKDFKALKKAIPALDALDFDDENSYDLGTTVKLRGHGGQTRLSRLAGSLCQRQLLAECGFRNQQETPGHGRRSTSSGLCRRLRKQSMLGLGFWKGACFPGRVGQELHAKPGGDGDEGMAQSMRDNRRVHVDLRRLCGQWPGQKVR